MLDDVLARLGVDAAGALAVVLSAVGIYLAFLLMVRLLGQRVLSRLSTFDAVVAVMLGAVAGRAVLGDTPTLAAGVLGLGTLFALEAAFGRLRSGIRVSALMNNRAVLLMAGDRVLEANLRRVHVVEAELHGALRKAGVRNLGEIACVVFEASGTISVLRRGTPVDPRLLAGVRDGDLVPRELLTVTPPDSTPPRPPGR
ncbi:MULTISPECIES: DUF421 domain-containing protein [Kocuria]|uniref:DUF421 domain-containing protein n=1 Tax=Kocuria oceani TaxID=988827 RepID=A0ABV9TMX0_9MICC|nr:MULTISPECIES: YetF domain-containing protein [Kocuria]KLU08166.1 hypothetical protein ABL57_18995 [Kocuria sp. SM24M-10]OLT09161.1 hypothetical protein BJF77_01455 [Kocuria sp. CNJ-770]